MGVSYLCLQALLSFQHTSALDDWAEMKWSYEHQERSRSFPVVQISPNFAFGIGSYLYLHG